MPTPTPINVFTIITVVSALITELQKDLADGKISLDEGANLAEILAQNLQILLPTLKPEADLVQSIAAAILAYEAAKKAAPPAVAGV